MPYFETHRFGSGGYAIPFRDTVTGNGSNYVYNGILDDGVDTPNGGGTVYVQFPWGGWAYFECFPVELGPNPNPIGVGTHTWVARSVVTLLAHPSLSSTVNAHSDEATTPLGPNTGAQVTGSYTGTLAADLNADEWLFLDLLDTTEAPYWPDPSNPVSLPFALGNGAETCDSIFARKAALFLVPRVGQTVTVTVSVNGSSASQSFVWSSMDAFYYGLYHEIASGSHGIGGYGTADPRINGVHLFGQASYHYANGGNTYDATGSLSISSSEDGGLLKADAEIPTVYRMLADFVGADGAHWTDPLTVAYPGGSHAVTGSGTWDVEQKSWYAESYRGSTLLDSDAVSDEKGYMMAAITQGSLAASHLDKRDGGLMPRLYEANGPAISHDASHELSGTWSGVTTGGIGHVLSA